jgi:outer membrane protein OmpA-like peptidoglycan-associated protein
MRIRLVGTFVSWVALAIICMQSAFAGNQGSLIVRVSPPQTYIYADGQPVLESKGHYVTLTEGEHKIDLFNYGYKPETRSVTITAHHTTKIDVAMHAIPGEVSGPWGCITIEGPRGAAVLLNGTDPSAFFVGHVDEFNNEFVWKQELIVPPGKHQLTIAYANRDTWTTAFEVPANKRVVVDAYKGVRKTVAWSRGEQLKELPRFHAGIASDAVVVSKVTAQFGASAGQVNCGDSTTLKWSSVGAEKAELNGVPVSPTGDQSVAPKETTTYKFTAMGPGGVYTYGTTVNVNKAISASLDVTPPEVRTGEGANHQGTATVTWSAGNADSVTVDPLGSVGANGSREVQVTPATTSAASAEKTVTYTLHASNACGGSETRTATLHITGPTEVVNGAANETTLQTKLGLNSVYFPTDWPTKEEPQGGLVSSQEERAKENAADFKKYLAYQPEAKVILEAYADVRGSVPHNQALSERRAERIKDLLVEQGIPADRIEIRAFGKSRNLTERQVKELAAQNPSATPAERKQVLHEIVIFEWANNRRVDIRLKPTNQVSHRYFPFDAHDLKVLLGPEKPGAKQAASLN